VKASSVAVGEQPSEGGLELSAELVVLGAQGAELIGVAVLEAPDVLAQGGEDWVGLARRVVDGREVGLLAGGADFGGEVRCAVEVFAGDAGAGGDGGEGDRLAGADHVADGLLRLLVRRCCLGAPGETVRLSV